MNESTLATSTDADTRRSVWTEAGRGWGARAQEWAYQFEPYALPANHLLFDQLGVSDGTNHLDVACGSGLAANVAARRGASVSGLDASDALIDIARTRTPAGDFRVGDMFALPFDDGRFDVVTSFNGIWNGCDDALQETRRVLRSDGQPRDDLLGLVRPHGTPALFRQDHRTIAREPPSSHDATGRDRRRRREPCSNGPNSRLQTRGTVEVTNEWPDVDTAVRALCISRPGGPCDRGGRIPHVL